MSELNNDAVTRNYYYGQVVTAFKQVDQKWDYPLGAVVNQTARWRLVFIMTMIINLFLVVAVFAMIEQPKHRVFGVLMTNKGFVLNSGLLTQLKDTSKLVEASSNKNGR